MNRSFSSIMLLCLFGLYCSIGLGNPTCSDLFVDAQVIEASVVANTSRTESAPAKDPLRKFLDSVVGTGRSHFNGVSLIGTFYDPTGRPLRQIFYSYEPVNAPGRGYGQESFIWVVDLKTGTRIDLAGPFAETGGGSRIATFSADGAEVFVDDYENHPRFLRLADIKVRERMDVPPPEPGPARHRIFSAITGEYLRSSPESVWKTSADFKFTYRVVDDEKKIIEIYDISHAIPVLIDIVPFKKGLLSGPIDVTFSPAADSFVIRNGFQQIYKSFRRNSDGSRTILPIFTVNSSGKRIRPTYSADGKKLLIQTGWFFGEVLGLDLEGKLKSHIVDGVYVPISRRRFWIGDMTDVKLSFDGEFIFAIKRNLKLGMYWSLSGSLLHSASLASPQTDGKAKWEIKMSRDGRWVAALNTLSIYPRDDRSNYAVAFDLKDRTTMHIYGVGTQGEVVRESKW